MKLKVYQQGGGLIYTPFIPEQYADSSGRSSKSSSGSDDEDAKLDPLDKELLGLMKDQNLLPSDIQMIYNRLIAFQRSTQRLSGLEGTGSYRSVMPGMLQIMSLVSQAKYNKARADSAIKQMTDENTGSDIALDKYGRMYVQNMDGKIEKIKPSDYDIEKYRPISNSELMYLREQNLPFDSDILSDVAETVGMTSISKEIDRIIDAFGQTKTEGYFDKNSSEIFKALASKSPEGIYKLTEEKSSADLRKAWNIVFKQLPTNMQHVLDARAALSGSDPANFIHEIVLSNLDYTFGIDYDAQQSKAAGFDTDPNKTDSEKLQEKDNYQIRFATGQGMPIEVFLTPSAAKINEVGTFKVQGLDFGPMLNMDQLPIGQMNLQQLLFGNDKKVSALATSVRSTDVTFGNKLLNYSELPAIMFNNESLTSKVYLPYRNENGHFVPDFKKLEDFNAYMEDIKGKSLTVTERNGLLQKHNLNASDIIPSADGKSFTLRDTMPFLTFSAYAGDDTLKLTTDEKRYLAKVDRTKGRTLKDGYNRAVKYNDVYAKKNASPINSGFGKSGSGDFWEGLVFIPCPDAFYAMNSTKDQPITRSAITDYSSKISANEVLNQAVEATRSNPNYEINRNLGQFR